MIIIIIIIGSRQGGRRAAVTGCFKSAGMYDDKPIGRTKE